MDECPICLDNIQKCDTVKLKCGHIYHKKCIYEYVNYGYSHCCLCMKEFKLMKHLIFNLYNMFKTLLVLHFIFNIFFTIIIYLVYSYGYLQIYLFRYLLIIIWGILCTMTILSTCCIIILKIN